MKTKAKVPSPPPPRLFQVPLDVAENPEAKREYIRVLKTFTGKLDERDVSLLVDYALTHATIIELRGIVASEGYTCVGEKGGSYVNPTVNILTSRQTHLAQLRRDLYFTPRARVQKQTKALSRGQSILDSLKDENGEE